MNYNTLLVDASHLAYRVFFALPPLSFNENNTHMIYGFLSSLSALVRKQPIKHLIIIGDAGHKEKDRIYPDYKRKKSKGDPLDEERRLDFTTQFSRLNDFLLWLGVKNTYFRGVEADDIIGHLCTKRTATLRQDDIDLPFEVEPPILILSGDHDLNVLLSEDVSMHKPHKDVLYTLKSFTDEFPDLEPSQYKDVLALMGCSSDNVPGVKGIGPKYAVDLIRKYGSLDRVKETNDDGRIVKLAQENWKDVEMSYRLVSFEELDPVIIANKPNLAKVRRNFFALGMESLIESWADVVKLSTL